VVCLYHGQRFGKRISFARCAAGVGGPARGQMWRKLSHVGSPRANAERRKASFSWGVHLGGGLTPALVALLARRLHWRAVFVFFGLFGFVLGSGLADLVSRRSGRTSPGQPRGTRVSWPFWGPSAPAERRGRSAGRYLNRPPHKALWLPCRPLRSRRRISGPSLPSR
jgi:hypothetical protein